PSAGSATTTVVATEAPTVPHHTAAHPLRPGRSGHTLRTFTRSTQQAFEKRQEAAWQPPAASGGGLRRRSAVVFNVPPRWCIPRRQRGGSRPAPIGPVPHRPPRSERAPQTTAPESSSRRLAVLF